MAAGSMSSRSTLLFSVILLVTTAALFCNGASASLCCRGTTRSPVILREPLSFCSTTGLTSCCSKEDEAKLESIFLDAAGGAQINNVTDIGRKKASLCSRCIPAITNSPACTAADDKRRGREDEPASNADIHIILGLAVSVLIAIGVMWKMCRDDGEPCIDCGHNNCFNNWCNRRAAAAAGQEVELGRR